MGRPPKIAAGIGQRIVSLYGGRTRKEFAKWIGIGDLTLANYVRGDHEPSAEFLAKVRDKTGVDINWLLNGEADPARAIVDGSGAAVPVIGGRNGLKTPPSASFPMPPVSLLGSAAGSLVGSMALAVAGETVIRPPGLFASPDGYALRLTGSSMEPRYWPGDIIFVDPARPVRRGDIVVVQTQDWEGSDILAWLKQLERRDEEWVRVRQYNPESEIAWKAVNVRFIHRVLTANEVMGFA